MVTRPSPVSDPLLDAVRAIAHALDRIADVLTSADPALIARLTAELSAATTRLDAAIPTP